jgi:hypothetical protein
MNLYAYGNGNPVNYVDTDGHFVNLLINLVFQLMRVLPYNNDVTNRPELCSGFPTIGKFITEVGQNRQIGTESYGKDVIR